MPSAKDSTSMSALSDSTTCEAPSRGHSPYLSQPGQPVGQVAPTALRASRCVCSCLVGGAGSAQQGASACGPWLQALQRAAGTHHDALALLDLVARGLQPAHNLACGDAHERQNARTRGLPAAGVCAPLLAIYAFSKHSCLAHKVTSLGRTPPNNNSKLAHLVKTYGFAPRGYRRHARMFGTLWHHDLYLPSVMVEDRAGMKTCRAG